MIVKNNRKQCKTILAFAIGAIFLILLSYSIFNIILWGSDSAKTNKQITALDEIVKKSGIDFEKLKNINTDTKGWLKVRGTSINYPFVQSKNNEYYLTHSFDKSHNQSGWVFMDYRNNIDKLDQNTIIYAHARIDGTMFGSMKNALSHDWYSKADNYIIRVYTEKKEIKWKVFSVYRIKTTDDYLQTSFNKAGEFQSFLDLITGRSIYNFKTPPDKNDKILTLSTCYNETEKVVLHAKLTSAK